MSDKKHNYVIDVLYAFGTILVIAGHSHSSDWSTFSDTALNSIIGFIYSFHMHLFFFIAGFLFVNSSSLRNKGFKKWIGEKGLRLLVPYAVISVVAAVPKFYLENRTFHGLGKSLVEFALMPRKGVWGHLWFLPILFAVYFIVGFVWSLLKDNKQKKTSMFVMAAVFLVAYYIPADTYFFGISDLKKFSFFFVIGMIVKEYVYDRFMLSEKKYRALLWMLCFGVGTILIVNFRENIRFQIINALLMISACVLFASLMPELRVVKWISKNNYTIYLIAWPFQSVMMAVCDKMHFNWQITSISMFLTGIILPVIFITVYEKCKFLHNKFFNLVLGYNRGEINDKRTVSVENQKAWS